MYMLLLMDNLMDNSNMTMLSLEPRQQTITLHNNFTVSFFIQSAVGILEMLLLLLANQMLRTYVTTILK